MLDKSVQYYDVLMKRKIGTIVPISSLPNGFMYSFFKLGDEKSWAEIEGNRDVYLHTQTWSYKAINIYMKVVFNITSEIGLGGYENSNYEKAVLLLRDYIK